MTEPCPSCPVPPPYSCLSPSRFHAYCSWAASGDPAKRAAILRLSGVPESEPVPPSPPASRPARQPVTHTPSPATPRDPNSPIRCALLTPSLFLGGAEVWLAHLIRATASHGLHWAGVGLPNPSEADPGMRTRVAALCPVVEGWGPVRDLLASVDVAVVWGVIDSRSWFPPVGSPGRPRVVLVAHGIGPWTVRAVADAAHADALVAVCRGAVATFPEDQRARVEVIENAVDTTRLAVRESAADTRARWGLQPGEKALVYLGRLSPEKAPGSVAEGIAALHRRGRTEWRGVLVGDGWRADEVQAHAAAVALPGSVVFAGVTEAPGDALRAADLAILPSREEACPLAALEALWLRVPLVASAVGIMAEPELRALVREVSPGPSGEEVAAAVVAEETFAAASRERARRGRTYARERFEGCRWARRWADHLTGLVGAGRPAPDPTPGRR